MPGMAYPGQHDLEPSCQVPSLQGRRQEGKLAGLDEHNKSKRKERGRKEGGRKGGGEKAGYLSHRGNQNPVKLQRDPACRSGVPVLTLYGLNTETMNFQKYAWGWGGTPAALSPGQVGSPKLDESEGQNPS